jgi:hypothetical protein
MPGNCIAPVVAASVVKEDDKTKDLKSVQCTTPPLPVQSEGKSLGTVSVPEAKMFKHLGPIGSYLSAKPKSARQMGDMRNQEGIVVRTVYSQAFGCDAAGKSDTTADITPWSNTTEWSALTALYSEYRVLSVKAEIMPYARWTRSVSPISTNALAVGFNPVSSALSGGVRQIEELTNHKLFYPRLVTAGATAAADVYAFDTNGRPVTLHFKIPSGPLVVGSGTVYTTDWSSTAVQIPPGSIKLYSETSNISQNIAILFVTCEVAFRQRAF